MWKHPPTGEGWSMVFRRTLQGAPWWRTHGNMDANVLVVRCLRNTPLDSIPTLHNFRFRLNSLEHILSANPQPRWICF